MLYQRFLEIERRLDTVLRLIRTGHYSTPRPGRTLKGVHPDRLTLRNRIAGRGYDIRAEKHSNGWY